MMRASCANYVSFASCSKSGGVFTFDGGKQFEVLMNRKPVIQDVVLGAYAKSLAQVIPCLEDKHETRIK